ncbi:MAG: NUDIX hydrolase [Firmicutes bacterium]|nr:NUDIX hydrolase [Bacillota bacterium]
MEERRGDPEVVFRGRVMTVHVDPVTAKSGPTTREVVDRVPAVAVVAETAGGSLVVVRQFRWAVQSWLYELPAGMVNAGEAPLAAAIRELEEETGYRATHWQLLYRYYSSPGYSNEMLYIFYAQGLERGTPHYDADEELEVITWTRQEAAEHLASGEVLNGMLLIGVSWWLHQSRSA